MARVNRTTGFFLILGVVVLLATVTAGAWIKKNGSDQPGSDGLPADTGVFASGIADVASGLAALVPSIPGKVTAVLVKEGDPVTAGQVLVQLDDSAARHQLAIAEQGLVVAGAKLDAAKEQVKKYPLEVLEWENKVDQARLAHKAALTEFHKARELVERKVVSDAEHKLQLAETAVLMARKNMETAEKALEMLKGIDPKVALKEPEESLKEADKRLTAAKATLDSFVIKAPSDGTIYEINYQVGGSAPLPIGDANASKGMIFCPNEALVVRAEIDQEWAMMVKPGMPVTLTVQAAGGDLKWTGKVEKVASYIQRRRPRIVDPDTFNDARTRECIIRVDPNPDPDPKKQLLHGMRVQVQIHTTQS